MQSIQSMQSSHQSSNFTLCFPEFAAGCAGMSTSRPLLRQRDPRKSCKTSLSALCTRRIQVLGLPSLVNCKSTCVLALQPWHCCVMLCLQTQMCFSLLQKLQKSHKGHGTFVAGLTILPEIDDRLDTVPHNLQQSKIFKIPKHLKNKIVKPKRFPKLKQFHPMVSLSTLVLFVLSVTSTSSLATWPPTFPLRIWSWHQVMSHQVVFHVGCEMKVCGGGLHIEYRLAFTNSPNLQYCLPC